MNVNNNREFIVIDNEYAGWNPMAMDLAVYINETMNHNSHPGKNGVEWYLDNIMNMEEQELLIKSYMKHYFDNYLPKHERYGVYNDDFGIFISKTFAPFHKQVWDCCLLNNFFWGVWALSLLDEEEYLNNGIFNYDFAHSRCDMYQQFNLLI